MKATISDHETQPAPVDIPSGGVATAGPFQNSLEHILAEIERIDLLVEAQVGRARQLQKDDEFQGLYISEQEVDTLMAQPIGLPRWAVTQPANADPDVRAGLDHLRAQIDARKKASLDLGVPLRLVDLTNRFQLSAFDVDVLLLCLAAEIDLRYERLYSYLQDDVTKKRPSVDLALNLLCGSFSSKLEARSRFDVAAPLLRHELIAVHEDTAHPKSPLLNRFLKLDERIVNYLLGRNEIDVRLLPYTSIADPKLKLEEMVLPADLLNGLRLLFENQQKNSGRGLNLYLQGPYGVGKRSTAGALCRQVGLKLLIVAAENLASTGGDFTLLVRLIAREAILQEAAVYWHSFDTFLAEDQRASLAALVRALQQSTGVVFLSGEAVWEPADTPDLPPFVRIEFPRPHYADRLLFWERALDGSATEGVDVTGLANKFRFTGGQIRDAAVTARNLSLRRDPDHVSLGMADLLEACRLQSNRKLTKLATSIKPHYSWSDIVLPPDKLRQLREVCYAVEYRSIVYDEWGFDNKLSLGKGLSLLFAGPSGTGKTMAAEILAGELGLDLYKIDLSTVISKYIGETEKNLSRIFTEAATSNAVLFFDEADALFGKRSEVRDSHDRYANIEINYLLQRMEEYEGTVILATNLRKNMDDAFVRRIQFTIEFPFPSFDQRLAIWQRAWPENTPRKDLDIDFMAKRFEITGGNIRNIALSAAFLGAEDGGCVRMKHLIRATWQEYQKMGKVIVDGEFGEYRDFS
jgi:SpoVK/Ycf46/Vps4 family AAA+-type ATPase